MEFGTSKTPDLSAAFNLRDPSLWAIILGNLFSIILAVIQDWPLGEIMWVYWGQSVIIGVMNVLRMLSLKEFSTEGLRMNEQPVPETPAAKVEVATFFAFHYGFFHFVYAIFLWQEMPLDTLDINHAIFMLLCITGFVGSHSFSLFHNMNRDFRQQKPNLGTLMFYPYLRIIPMHLAIIFGSQIEALGLLLFMGLKTLADAGTHMIEHHLFQKPGSDGPVQMRD